MSHGSRLITAPLGTLTLNLTGSIIPSFLHNAAIGSTETSMTASSEETHLSHFMLMNLFPLFMLQAYGIKRLRPASRPNAFQIPVFASKMSVDPRPPGLPAAQVTANLLESGLHETGPLGPASTYVFNRRGIPFLTR